MKIDRFVITPVYEEDEIVGFKISVDGGSIEAADCRIDGGRISIGGMVVRG